MITALVQFALPAPLTPEQARQVFASTAPRYLAMPGDLNYGQALAMSTLLMVVCALAIFLLEHIKLPGISEI